MVEIAQDRIDEVIQALEGRAVHLVGGEHDVFVKVAHTNVLIRREDGNWQIGLGPYMFGGIDLIPKGIGPASFGPLQLWPPRPSDSLGRLKQMAYFTVARWHDLPALQGRKATLEEVLKSNRLIGALNPLTKALENPTDPEVMEAMAHVADKNSPVAKAIAVLGIGGLPDDPIIREAVASVLRRQGRRPSAEPFETQPSDDGTTTIIVVFVILVGLSLICLGFG